MQDIRNQAITDNKHVEYVEQDFRVTKETTWDDMLREVLMFWMLIDEEDIVKSTKPKAAEDKDPYNGFTLVLPNMHNIMSLNRDEGHVAKTLSKYFEINRSKRATLLLIKPDKEQKEVSQEERQFLRVKHAKKTNRFQRDDDRTPDQIAEDTKRQNQELFFKKYPDIEEEMIQNMEQFDRSRPIHIRMRNILSNPDMSFCSFIISLCMFLLSLYTFYSQRDFNNEYFNR